MPHTSDHPFFSSFCLFDCFFKGSSFCVHTFSVLAHQVLFWTSLLVINVCLYSCQPWDYSHSKSSFPYLPVLGLIIFSYFTVLSNYVQVCDFYGLQMTPSVLLFPTVYCTQHISTWKCQWHFTPVKTDFIHNTLPTCIHTSTHFSLGFHLQANRISCKSGSSLLCLSSFKVKLLFSSVLAYQCSLSPPTSISPACTWVWSTIILPLNSCCYWSLLVLPPPIRVFV